jgi:hypothetical protein
MGLAAGRLPATAAFRSAPQAGGAGSHAVTAIVTKTTRVTGKVSSIAGIKVGELVSETITGTDGKLTADTIQDPASLP